MSPPLMELHQVSRAFAVRRGVVRAVDRVSVSVFSGEVLCLVGESGCGKTTTGKLICGLLRPTSGRVLYRGEDLAALDPDAFRRFRRAVQIVHQDPYASLNPARTVLQTLKAPLVRHRLARTAQQLGERVEALLTAVGLTPAHDFMPKYPHQLSGGQRQRVAVARALTVEPELIVADEAVSMVDVSLRVGILDTLARLQAERGITFVFITHDLALARHFARHGRIAVMYLGRIVEIAPASDLIQRPRHPYTRALLAAVPEPDPDTTRRPAREGLRTVDVPSLLERPDGCAFHPRCPLFEPGLCDVHDPDLIAAGGAGLAACHVVARETSARRSAEGDPKQTAI